MHNVIGGVFSVTIASDSVTERQVKLYVAACMTGAVREV